MLFLVKVICAVLVCWSVLIVGVVPVVAHNGHNPQQVGTVVSTNQIDPPTVADVRARDNLVFAQEGLLNSYRCRFGIDIGVVPGGCRDGKPARTLTQPQPFLGQPTSLGIAQRDRLIEAQEWQLNTIRCRFGIDMSIVPGLCSRQDVAVSAQKPLIVVPPQAPSGKCASYIGAGIYDWEQQCAWREHYLDKTHNYSVSDGEAAKLLRRIWEEVDVAGKPAEPPTAALVPSGTECAAGGTIGCYRHSLHHIDRLDSFLLVLLHETAHALIADHPSLKSCSNLDDDTYQACVHNDIFRCVADHLYVTYALIPTGGVCGATNGSTVAPNPTPAPQTGNWESRMFDTIWYAQVEDILENGVYLQVVCGIADGDVYVWVDTGEKLWSARTVVNGGYDARPYGWLDWSDVRRDQHLRDNVVWIDLIPGSDFVSVADDDDIRNIVNLLRISPLSEILIWAEVQVGRDTSALWAFPLEQAVAHIDPVLDKCGWVEVDEELQPTPTSASTEPFSFQFRCIELSWSNTPRLEVLWNAGQSNFDYETRRFDLEIREQSSGRTVKASSYAFKSSRDEWQSIFSADPNSGEVYEMRARETELSEPVSAWSAWETSNRCP